MSKLHHARKPFHRGVGRTASLGTKGQTKSSPDQCLSARKLPGLVAALLRKRRTAGAGPQGKPECPPRPSLRASRHRPESRNSRPGQTGSPARGTPRTAVAPLRVGITLSSRRTRRGQDHVLPLAGLGGGQRCDTRPSCGCNRGIRGKIAGWAARAVSAAVPLARMVRSRGMLARQRPLDPHRIGRQLKPMARKNQTGWADLGRFPR